MAHAHNLLAMYAKRNCKICRTAMGPKYAIYDRHPACEARLTPCDLCNQPLGDEDGPAHHKCLEEEMQRVDERLLP